MPTVNKQTTRTPERVTQNGPASSVADLFRRAVAVGNLNSVLVKMLLYGSNRSGKTFLACSLPKPLLLLSFEPNEEGGAKTVKRFGAVTFLALKRKEEMVMLADHMRTDIRSPWRNGKEMNDAHGHPAWTGDPWKTVVLDTVTSLQDVLLAELMGLDNVPVQLNWGSVPEGFYAARSEQAKEVARKFLNLPVNVVINAKEKDHNPPKNEKGRVIGTKLMREMRVPDLQQESFFSADVGAATAQWLGDACDYLLHLQVVKEVKEVRNEVEIMGIMEKSVRWEETGRLVRRLRCGAADGMPMCHPNFASGFRSENPEAVPEFIYSPTWDKIAAVIRGEKLKQ